MMRYGTGRPIATVKVVNSQRPTYLVLLPGVEQEKPGQATMAGDALIGYYNVAALDAYRLAIMDAVSKLPRGATLILAGHSLGGIEAQNVVQSLAQRYGFKVAQVVSFGAPVMDGGQPGTNYLNVRSLGDPLQALDRRFLLPGDPNLLISKNGIGNPLGPNGSHNNYDKNSSGLSQHPVPRVSTLTTQCYEIDLSSRRPTFFRELPAQGSAHRMQPGQAGRAGRRSARGNPRRLYRRKAREEIPWIEACCCRMKTT
jgi:pimeloyl-ACP methyl ester carboxylesterase